jgi:hypothetical protein
LCFLCVFLSFFLSPLFLQDKGDTKEGKKGKDEAYCRVAAAVDSAARRLPKLSKPIVFQLLCHFSQYKGWEPGSARAGKASEAAGKKAAKRPRGAAEAAGKKAAKRPRA